MAGVTKVSIDGTFYDVDDVTAVDYSIVQSLTDGQKARARDNIGAASANEVSNKASVIIDSASGAVASFPDGAESPAVDVTIGIEPVQDLHGYDHPWPAGGGKNLLPMTVEGIKAANTNGSWSSNVYTINGGTFTILTDDDWNVIGLKVNGTFNATTIVRVSNDISLTRGGSYKLNGCATDTINCRFDLTSNTSGSESYVNIVGDTAFTAGQSSFRMSIIVNSGYQANNIMLYPMIRLASVSDATFEPYSNVCPISGWTGANVTRTGFNVWDEEWETGLISPDTGQNVWTNNLIRTRNYISVIPNGSYYFKTPIALSLRYYDINKNYLGYTDKNGSSDVVNGIRVMPDNTYYLRFQVYNTYGTTYNHDICINISDPAKNGTYEPSHVVTYPISWQSEAGTVYGGTLDVTTGVLTVTMAEVDLGTLTWNAFGEIYSDGFYTALNDGYLSPTVYGSANGICEAYQAEVAQIANLSDKFFTLGSRNVYNNRGSIMLRDSAYSYDNVSALQSALSGVHLVYELATPQTYQLTPTEVEMLLGENNVWADTGDSTVVYRADTRLYIQKINAPTDDDMIADAQIASGKYFIIGGNLYQSTTTIPAGDAITPGTNCILTNLADALNALNT